LRREQWRVSVLPQNRTPFEQTVLLLQGGGALGSYQAGVYQALAEADLHPDWVAGISIGAINSAIIAGNPPDQGPRTSSYPGCLRPCFGRRAAPIKLAITIIAR
jgi:hypothetical protein